MRSMNKLARSVTILSQYSMHPVMLQPNKLMKLNYPIKFYHEGSVMNSNSKPGAAFSEKQLNSGSTSTSSSSESESEDKEEWNEEEKLRSRILEAALPFVTEYGWTADAIAKGAESLGYSSMVHGMFDKGGTDLVNHFYSQCNSRLENELQNLMEKKKTDDGKKTKTTEFIRNAVEIRLRMNLEYIDSWPKALVLHGSLTNFPTSLNNIGTLVDTVWYYAGDRSYDFNWYTKRSILAAIYKSTEFCMLQDKSDDFQDTWSFLDRRLSEVVTVGKCLKQTRQTTKDFVNVLQVGFITVQNIMGLSMKSR